MTVWLYSWRLWRFDYIAEDYDSWFDYIAEDWFGYIAEDYDYIAEDYDGLSI